MKLTIFQSEDGDCLLLEGAGGGLVLCDGGRARSMRTVVLPELAKLRTAGKVLDAVYVSHIDQDHITGVITLLEAEAEWRVYDFHKKNKHPTIKPPNKARPPEVRNIWHNAFESQVEKPGEATELLAAAAPAMLASASVHLRAVGEHAYQIATSVSDGIKVARYASPDFLDIPTNVLAGHPSGKVLMVRPGVPPVPVGSMTMTVIGPFQQQLTDLKTCWDEWVRNNKAKVAGLDDDLRRSINNFATGRPSPLEIATAGSGYDGVSIPNVASLMFMAEENGKRILLTGDSHSRIVIEGLDKAGFPTANGLHVDVLKVQHHGAAANMKDETFPQLVSADHYVFCGNGGSGNPEPEVVQRVYDSRLGKKKVRALASQAEGRPFTMWFSTTSGSGASTADRRKIMRELEVLAKKLASKSGGMMTVRFNTGPSLTLSL